MNFPTGYRDGNAHRIGVYKVGTVNRATNVSEGQYQYVVNLPEHVSNVVGIEVEQWKFPRSLAPPFQFKNTFTLRVKGPAEDAVTSSVIPPETFSVTLPPEYMMYQNKSQAANSYVTTLARVLNKTVKETVGSNYRDKVFFTAIPMPDAKTTVTMDTIPYTGASGSPIRFELDFTNENSPAEIMGFRNANYTSVESPEYVGVAGNVQTVVSAAPANLNFYRYVNVFVEEVKENYPLATLYTNPGGERTTRSMTSYPSRILRSAIQRLSRLTVTLRLSNGEFPVDTDPHDLMFVIFYLDTQNTMPGNSKQAYQLASACQYIE